MACPPWREDSAVGGRRQGLRPGPESAISKTMTMLTDKDGFDLLVNGEMISFRDTKELALAAAIYMKTESKKYRAGTVQIRSRATGEIIGTILPDGRVE